MIRSISSLLQDVTDLVWGVLLHSCSTYWTPTLLHQWATSLSSKDKHDQSWPRAATESYRNSFLLTFLYHAFQCRKENQRTACFSAERYWTRPQKYGSIQKKNQKKPKNTVHCPLSSETSVCNYCIILKSFCYFHMEVPHCRPAIYLDIYGAYSNLCTAYYNINTAVGWEVWGLKHPKQIRSSILKFSIRMIVYCLQVYTPFQNHLP